jgi:hypothetical protein
VGTENDADSVSVVLVVVVVVENSRCSLRRSGSRGGGQGVSSLRVGWVGGGDKKKIEIEKKRRQSKHRASPFSWTANLKHAVPHATSPTSCLLCLPIWTICPSFRKRG